MIAEYASETSYTAQVERERERQLRRVDRDYCIKVRYAPGREHSKLHLGSRLHMYIHSDSILKHQNDHGDNFMIKGRFRPQVSRSLENYPHI